MKRLGILLGVALCLCLPATAVLAIALPTPKSMNPPVQAYQGVRVPGDVLFVGKYTIYYASLPSESTQDAYLIRVLNSTGVPVASRYPRPYHTKGYGDGGYGIYVESGIIWNGAYTVQLIGNPTLAWDGTIPQIDITAITWNSSTLGLPAYILNMAQELETAWGTGYDLVETLSGSVKLTAAQGISYFTSIIPYLWEICPTVFPVGVLNVEYERKPYTYNAGIATFTQGSNAVVGVGTDWELNMEGTQIKPDADTDWLTVLSVSSPTALTLTANYVPVTKTGVAYTMNLRQKFVTELMAGGVTVSYGTYFTDIATWLQSDAVSIKTGVFLLLAAVTLMVIMITTKDGWAVPVLMAPLLYIGNTGGFITVGITITIAFLFFFLFVFLMFMRRTTA